MTALKLSPGTMRCVVSGLLSGQNTATVFHMTDTTSPTRIYTQGQLDAMASQIRLAWVAQFIPRQSGTDFSLGAVTVTDIGTPLGLVGVQSGTTAGTRAAVSLPANVAACISWRVPLHFRGGHCRTYLAGVTQVDQANATSWTTGFVTTLTTAANNFLAAINAPVASMTPVMCMLSRQRGGVIFNVPERYTVSAATVDNRVDSMRRRLGKDR